MQGVIKENQPKYLQLIFQKTKLIDHIFRDLLELSKLEARKLEFRFVTVSAQQLFQELRDKYKLDLHNSRLTVHWAEFAQHGADQVMVKADMMRIEQVFGNLLGNAKKFTPAEGTITVRAQLARDVDGTCRFEVSVADTGPGIQAEELPFLFDRFYRGKNSHKQRHGGYGLGLAISKEILEYHEGRIYVISRVNEGSTFTFSLLVEGVTLATDGEDKEMERK